MKFCSKCGKEVKEEANFCEHCGNALNDALETEKTEMAEDPPSTSNPECVMRPQSAAGKEGGAKKSYIATVLSAIITFIIRIAVQEDQIYHINIVDNRYVIGIDQDLKGLFTLIPGIALIIAALVVSSDRKTDSQKKLSVFVVNLVYIALSALFIWLDIPQELFDF